MASISSLGLSGLPLNDLLNDLRKVEEAPLQQLAARKSTIDARISSYATLSNMVSTFQTAAKALTEAKTYSSLKITVSNTDALTATAAPGGGAVAGTYNINVIKLADTQTLASAGQTARDQALSSEAAKLTFTLGDGTVKELKLEAGTTSLDDIRKAINASDLGLSATIIKNGDDDAPFVLSISTTATGTDARIASISSDNGDLQAVLSYNEDAPENNPGSAMTQVRTAVDAQFSVNGISITSGNNTVKDAIEGVEIALKAPTEENKPLTLTIAEDRDTTRSAVERFVNTYNTLQSTIKSLTSYNVETQTSSALTGDHVARSVQTQLRSIMGSLVNGEGDISTLSQLGITTNVTTGALEINTEKLNEALNTRMGDVEAFFNGEQGLVAKLNARIDTMLGPKGSIAAGQDGAKASIKALENQYDSMTSRIDQRMETYRMQFVALEKVMSQMNGTSSYLTSQLSMLEAMSKGSSSK